MEPSLAKGESVSLVSVIQEVRGHGYSDTAVQFFFICVLHISFRSVAVVLHGSWRMKSDFGSRRVRGAI